MASTTISPTQPQAAPAREPDAAPAPGGPGACEGFAAFISYRHTEPDRRWAIWLHGALERYRVPESLARAQGLARRVGRVFRDEEELAASADLSARIREALEASAFLIVVCSPRAPQSRWVNAEVDYFRSLGRGDRILALLVEGEPAESFPPSLSEIRRAAVSAGAETDSALETIEPLAADVRPDAHTSRRTREQHAKLRLLATMLGCRFDDVRQREQERRTRTLSYIVALLVVLVSAFAALGFWAETSRRTAVAERDRALRNQSLFLANLAQREVASGDATAGTLLALEALPRDLARPDRPYVPEAARALYEAVYARREIAVLRAAAPAGIAVFDPRGERVFVGFDDGSARLVGSADGGERARWPASGAPVAHAEFSADGARLATVYKSGIAKLWHATDGAEVATLSEDGVPVRRALFSPDGTRILVESERGGALFESETGRRLAALGSGAVLGGRFSPDGRRILAIALDGTARLYDAESGRETAALRHGQGILPASAFSSDGASVVTASIDGLVRVWDAASGAERTAIRSAPFLLDAALGPDGTRVLATSLLGTSMLWEIASGRQLGVFGVPGQKLQRAFFSPDGTRIVTEGHLETGTTLWDARSGTALGAIGRRPVFSPEGSRVSDGGRLWDAISGREIAVLRHDAPAPGSSVIYTPSGTVDAMTFSTEGSRMVTAGQDGTARLWRAADGAPIAVLRGHAAPVKRATFSGDGARVLTLSEDGTARLWDARAGVEVGIVRTAVPIHHVSSSRNGTLLLTLSDDAARLWSAADATERLVLRGTEARLRSAAFSPSGMRVSTVSEDRTVRIWDARDGRELAVLQGHSGEVRKALFSPDEALVLTYADDRTARLWSVGEAREVAVLRHEGQIAAASFSPDGARLVTVAQGASTVRPGQWMPTAYLWDVATGRLIATLREHDEYLNAALFSPDRKRVLTAAQDGGVRLWDAADGSAAGKLVQHENDVVVAAFSAEGRSVLTVAYDRVARLSDAVTGAEVAVFRQPPGVRHAILSHDGTRVLTLSSGVDSPRIWDAASGRELARLRGHDHHITSAAFGPDGRHVVTHSSGDGTVRLWDVRSGELLALVARERITEVGFTPDSARLIVRAEDGTVQLFPVFTEVASLAAHARAVVPRALSGEDRRRHFLEVGTGGDR